MKKLVKICVVACAAAVLMAIMAGPAMASMPGFGGLPEQPWQSIGGSSDENIYRVANPGGGRAMAIDPALVECMISGACQAAAGGEDDSADESGDGGNEESYNVPPEEELPTNPQEVPEEVPGELVPDTPGEQIVPDEPAITTEVTTEQPQLTTETTEVPSTSKLPNTGSTLLLVAGIGALLAGGAVAIRFAVTRRAC